MEEITFESLGLSENMLKALEKKGYGWPTTIQAEAIPHFMQWKDVIAKAPTGTGKTFAFGIPMIEHIDPELQEVQGLILAPTRELAIQIGDELRGLLTYYNGIRVAVLYGGAGIGGQIKQLEKKPQIVVATPGRLMDHYNRKTIRLDKIQTVVLDEADRMLDMGFFKDVTRIIEKVKNRKNLGLFSATISQEVMTVSWMYQRDEVEITVEPKQQDRPDIDQYSLTCTPLERRKPLCALLRPKAMSGSSFSATPSICASAFRTNCSGRAWIATACMATSSRAKEKKPCSASARASWRSWLPPMLPPVASMLMMWIVSSTTMCPMKTNIMSIVLAAPAVPSVRALHGALSAISRRRPNWTRSVNSAILPSPP